MSRWHIADDPDEILAEAKQEARAMPLSSTRWAYYQAELERLGINERTAREVLNFAVTGHGDVLPPGSGPLGT